jgi:hypothetical protein
LNFGCKGAKVLIWGFFGVSSAKNRWKKEDFGLENAKF